MRKFSILTGWALLTLGPLGLFHSACQSKVIPTIPAIPTATPTPTPIPGYSFDALGTGTGGMAITVASPSDSVISKSIVYAISLTLPHSPIDLSNYGAGSGTHLGLGLTSSGPLTIDIYDNGSPVTTVTGTNSASVSLVLP